MLRFRLSPLWVPSLERHFLPLPKLSDAQLSSLSSSLAERGFKVSPGRSRGRRLAVKGSQRILVDGGVGLAASGQDLLDALGPEVPSLLETRAGGDADVSGRYLAVKRSASRLELQLFPRMESLRTWTCLRRDGLCGLTPDEAEVLRLALGEEPASSSVRCVTEKPTEGSAPFQAGRHLLYRSSMPAREFVSALRTTEPGSRGFAYLPRDSILALSGTAPNIRIPSRMVGQWCIDG